MNRPSVGDIVNIYRRPVEGGVIGPVSGPHPATVERSNQADRAWALNRGVSVRMNDTRRHVTLAVYSEEAAPKHSTTWRWPG